MSLILLILTFWLFGVAVAVYSLLPLAQAQSKNGRAWAWAVVTVVVADGIFFSLYWHYIGLGIPFAVYFAVLLLLFFLNPLICLYGLAGGGSRITPRKNGQPRLLPPFSRRKQLALSLALAGSLPATTLGTLFFSRHRDELELLHFSLARPPYRRPLRLLLMSDFHIGNFMPERRLQELLEIAQRTKPDHILLGGDFIDYHSQEINQHESFLLALARQTSVIAVLGNHDFFGNPEQVSLKFKRLGIAVLRDELLLLDNGIPLFGTRDYLWEGKQFSLEKLAAMPVPGILLTHNPDLALDLSPEEQSHFFLALAGHTHGGQICAPGGHPLVNIADPLFQPGWNQGPTLSFPLLLTKGVGYGGLPLRLYCNPDVMIIDL